MAKNKTAETLKSVTGFIDAVPDETKRDDSFKIIQIMKKATGLDPKMWGPSIIGFGSVHYKYASGHEGDMPIIAFSPRKTAIVLYLGLSPEKREKYLKQFGKYKSGKGCIYVKKLEDVNMDILKEMVNVSVKDRKREP